MQKIQRLAAIGAMGILTLGLAACGGSGTPSAEAPAPTTPATGMSSAPSGEAMAGGMGGVTQISDIFGPGCSQVPTEGEGSAEGMVDDPVATAASNNPLLTTLVTAVGAVPGLADTLNSAEELTVFAPANSAFEAIPADQLNALLADPAALATVLQGHVVDTRYTAEELVEAGTVTTLSGEVVTIGGTADAPTFSSGGTTTPATNLCGNVPTANATVFVIDSVLLPSS